MIQQKDPIEIINELKNNLDNLEKQNIIKYFNIKKPKDVELKDEEKFILKDFIPIPKKAVTLLSARGGSGKSWLVLQLALRYVNKYPNKKVFLWLSEDTLEDSKSRMIHILNHIFTNEVDLITDLNHPVYDNLYFLGSETRPFHFIEYEYRQKNINSLFYRLKNECKNFDFIILDPLISFYGGDENNNSQAREFMDLLNEWANKENKAILLVHHNNKSITGGIRGASAFVDAVRVQYELCKIEDKEKNQDNIDAVDDGIRIIKLIKDNKGAIKHFGMQQKIKIFDFNNEFIKKETNNNNEKKSIIDLI
jgi:replicative DNA helicase